MDRSAGAVLIEPRCSWVPRAAQMLRVFRISADDVVYFIAATCVTGAGAMVGMLLADIALNW